MNVVRKVGLFTVTIRLIERYKDAINPTASVQEREEIRILLEKNLSHIAGMLTPALSAAFESGPYVEGMFKILILKFGEALTDMQVILEEIDSLED